MIQSRWLSLLCIIFVLFTIPSCSDPEKKKLNHYSKAMEYIQQEDQKSAILELKNAIQIDPKFANARYQLGLIHLKEGNPKAAFDELQRTVTLDPTNVDAGIKVAEFYLLGKNIEESRKHVEKVLETDPGNPDALALLANIELASGNYDAAHATLDKITGEAASSDKIYGIRGRLLASQKKYEESEEILLKALELDPAKFPNYKSLLMLYQQQKRTEDIEKLLEKALKEIPDNANLYMMLANFHISVKNYDKAEEAILQAIKTDPDQESYRLFGANFYKQHGKADQAIRMLETARDKFPNSHSITATLADLKFDTKKIDEARSLVDNILASNPEHGMANFVKAKLLLNDEQYREASDQFTRLTTNYPKWADPYYFQALTHMRLGEIELAQKASETALQLAPANSRFHTLQSQILLMQGDAENAGKEASIALQLNTKNFPAAKLLIKSLVQAKRFEEAIKLITSIRAQVPLDVDLIGTLGLAYLGNKQLNEAENTFQTLLEIDPDNSKALTLLTSISANGDPQKAIKLVRSHIEKAKDAPGHYMLLGDLLARTDQPEEALEAFATAQKLAPDNAQPYIVRAQLMHSLGKTEQAVNEFQQLIQAQPDSVPAHLGLATLYEAQEKLSEAKAQYEHVLKVAPNQPAAANNLAYLTAMEEGGDLGEALRLAMLAKQALPEDPRIADTLGMVHYKRKAYGLAASQFQQALTAQPDNPIINYHLALAQAANENKDGALASLKKALSSDEKFAEREEAEKLLNEIK